ncbi:MAG: MFS transporter [Bacteroidota bacterium]
MKNADNKTGTFLNFPRVFWTANTLELFERWAYYGIFNLLALYLTNSTETGALGFTQVEKGLIMGIVNAILYFLPIITGALADKLGYKKVLITAFLILSSGYYLMGQVSSFPAVFITFFYVAIGAALFKPIISATVAKTTNEKNSSLGFGIFYMMVNIGALLGPFLASDLREKSWDLVFLMSSGAILVNLVLCLLFYREPGREKSSGVSIWETVKKSWQNIIYALSDLRFLLFLIILTGAWTVYWQYFYSLPVFIDQWSNTSLLYNYLLEHTPGIARAVGTSEGIINAEKLITLDAFFIVALQIVISSLVKRFRPLTAMVGGMLVNTIGLYLAFSTRDPFLLVLSIFVFGIGEMSYSPKILEYIGSIAPKDKAALYMGTQFVPIALGNFIGGFISGGLYERLADKKSILARYLLEEKGISGNLDFNQYLSISGLSGNELNDLLWNYSQPWKFGFILLVMGLITALLFAIYNVFMKRAEKKGS